MSASIALTVAANEAEKGRVALWLDPDDLRWLAEHCHGPDDAPPEDHEHWARLRFRVNAALHKAGMKERQSE